MEASEIELTIHALEGGRFTGDLRFHAANSAALDQDLCVGAPIPLDLVELRSLEAELSTYGRRLTEMVFADAALRAAWATAVSTGRGSDEAKLRLRLRIDPRSGSRSLPPGAPPGGEPQSPGSDGRLHAIRWETLQNPLDGIWLCRDARFLVSRYLNTQDAGALQLRAGSSLRALVALSQPDRREARDPELPLFSVADELKRSRAALGEDVAVMARAHGGAAVNLDALVGRLRDGYAVLYLVCHGALVRDTPYLFFERDDGGPLATSGAELVERIRSLSARERPLLVVLASCQSAGSGSSSGAAASQAVLAAVGPQLALAGVAAVLGMQGDAPADLVARVMPAFFSALRTHGQVDRALAEARSALPQQTAWWLPVLYMRLADGRLFTQPGSADGQPPSSPEAATLSGAVRALSDGLGLSDERQKFQDVLEGASQNITLINQCKKLHDLLQQLEKSFNIVVSHRDILNTIPQGWRLIKSQLNEIRSYLQDARKTIAESVLTEHLGQLRRDIEPVLPLIDQVKEKSDPELLDELIGEVNRILTLGIPRANTILVSEARDLRLDRVLALLGGLQRVLAQRSRGSALLPRLDGLISSLTETGQRLRALVAEHDQWQPIDDTLRSVFNTGAIPTEFKRQWKSLARAIDPLVKERGEDWAQDVARIVETLKNSVKTLDDSALLERAQDLYSQTNRRFMNVDEELLLTCAQLEKHSARLQDLLRGEFDERHTT